MFSHFADEQERWWLRLCILFWWTNWWDPISGAAFSVVSISLNRPHSELMLICNVVQGDFYSDYDASDFGQGQESQVWREVPSDFSLIWCPGGLQRGLQGWLWRRHRKLSTTWKTRSQCQLWPSLLQPGPLWLPKLPRLLLKILVFCSILPILLIVEIWSKILMSRSITSLYNLHMTRSQMLLKVESNGGPILKVVLECEKSCSEPFLIYIYGIQCNFMQKSCWKHQNFENR